MPRYRCNNADCSELPGGAIGYDFAGDKPVCPKCKHSGDDPNFTDMIATLTDVHLLASDPNGQLVSRNLGRRVIACQPQRKDIGGNVTSVTADPSCVTCDACRATQLFDETVAKFAGNGAEGIKQAVAGQKLSMTI